MSLDHQSHAIKVVTTKLDGLTPLKACVNFRKALPARHPASVLKAFVLSPLKDCRIQDDVCRLPDGATKGRCLIKSDTID